MRNTKSTKRNYSLSDEKLSVLWKAIRETGEFQNPYRKKGIYHALVQALINLGVNESHTFRKVKNEVKSILESQSDGEQTAWDKFYNKSEAASNTKTVSWDVNTRIEETAKILQRIRGNHPYGEKLRQLHACIDILDSTDPIVKSKPNMRLNTLFDCPEVVFPRKIYVNKSA